MTLHIFEAIRELKPGQAIVDMKGDQVIVWETGCKALLQTPVYNSFFDCRIIDLPKPQPTLYDVLVVGATSKRIRCSDINYSCAACKYHDDDCTEINCSTALIDTLQAIALAAGFDLKKITAGEGGA